VRRADRGSVTSSLARFDSLRSLSAYPRTPFVLRLRRFAAPLRMTALRARLRMSALRARLRMTVLAGFAEGGDQCGTRMYAEGETNASGVVLYRFG